MAFLEYLADQVEVSGKLVGPLDMQSANAENTNEQQGKLDKTNEINTQNSLSTRQEDKNNRGKKDKSNHKSKDKIDE